MTVVWLTRPVIKIERKIIETVPTSLAGIRAVLALAADYASKMCPLAGNDSNQQEGFYTKSGGGAGSAHRPPGLNEHRGASNDERPPSRGGRFVSV
jgi:hypothetical protein